MHRVSTYRLILLLILGAGIAVESRIMTSRTHLRLTRSLTDFPMRIDDFQGADEQDAVSESVHKKYWPAEIVDRTYTNRTGDLIQVFICPDIVGAHRQEVCAQYAGWKVVQKTSGVLPQAPRVRLTRTIVSSPPSPGSNPALLACDNYWRMQERGLSEEDANSLFSRRSFCFRVLMCIETSSLQRADDAFTKLDAFATKADPVISKCLQKAETE